MRLFYSTLLILTFASTAYSLPDDMPVKIRWKVAAVMELVDKGVHTGSQPEASEQYFDAVRQLGDAVDEPLEQKCAALVPDLEAELVIASGRLRRNPERAAEIAKVYGRLPHDGPGPKHHVRRVPYLRPEHSGEDYRAAWEVWLLAPASDVRDLLRSRAYDALWKMRDARSLPVLEIVFSRLLKDKELSPTARAYEGARLLEAIAGPSNDRALDALRRCFLAAKAANLLSTFTDESLDDAFVRLLTSSAKVEGYPPSNSRWKDYVPLVERELQQENSPASWGAILERSLAIMKRRINGE